MKIYGIAFVLLILGLVGCGGMKPLSEEDRAKVRDGYRPFVLLDAAFFTLENSVVQIDSGAVEGFGTIGVMAAPVVLFEGLAQLWAQEPPLPVFEAKWDEGSEATGDVRGVYNDWVNQEPSAEEVLGRLARLKEEYAVVMTEVDEALIKEYGFSKEELEDLRADILNEVLSQLQAVGEE